MSPLRLIKKGFGGIAQLGEHLPCKQGVSGSNPLTSTKEVVFLFEERLHIENCILETTKKSRNDLSDKKGRKHLISPKERSSKKGHTVNALASGAEEGRGKLREAPVSCKQV